MFNWYRLTKRSCSVAISFKNQNNLPSIVVWKMLIIKIGCPWYFTKKKHIFLLTVTNKITTTLYNLGCWVFLILSLICSLTSLFAGIKIVKLYNNIGGHPVHLDYTNKSENHYKQKTMFALNRVFCTRVPRAKIRLMKKKKTRALNAYDGLYKNETRALGLESVTRKRAVEQQNSARKRISLTTPSSVDHNNSMSVNHQRAFFFRYRVSV